MESGCTATLNGQPYSSGTTINVEGEYEFIVFDKYGNQGTWIITIDKTPPVLSVISNGQALENGEITRYNVYTVWDDVSATATLNGNPVNNGACIEDEGEYTLIGTTTSYDITIDRTAPDAKIFNVDNSTEEIKVNYAVSNIYFTWEEQGCTATLNGEPYQKKTYITKDGGYSFTLTDKAGNTNTYNITVLKAKPEIIFISEESQNELKNNSSTTDNVLIVKLDDEDIITLNGEVFNTDNPIKEVGKYTFTVTNVYGNSAEFSITIKELSDEKANTGALSFFQGSTTGTIIFFSVLSILAVGLIVVPLIKNKVKGGSFKRKLK